MRFVFFRATPTAGSRSRSVAALALCVLLAGCASGGAGNDTADGGDTTSEAAGADDTSVADQETETGASETGASETGAEATAGEGAGEEPGGTRTVEHALGTTEVPASPERVVTLGYVTVFEVADILGISDTIVGARPDITDFDYFVYRDDLADIGDPEQPNLERIVALEPDLIIGLELTLEPFYDQLARIAPTVGVEWPGTSAGFLEVGRRYAEALGGDDGLEAYEEVVDAYLARAARIGERATAGGQAPAVAIMRVRETGQRYELPGIYSGHILYEDVGLPVPEGLRAAAKAGEATLPVSSEELTVAAPEHLFVYSGVGDDAFTEAERSLATLRETNPLFGELPAAQADQVHPVGGHWFSGNVLGAELVLDDVEAFVLDDRG